MMLLPKKRPQSILLILIVLASALRIFVCFQHNPLDYLYIADAIRHWLNGIRFPRGGYVSAADPIGYQVYIAVLRRVTGDNRFLVAAASALLSVVMPWLYYRAARNFGMRKTSALWVWLLIAVTPSLFVIYHYIMMETLLLVLEGAALWATARYLRKGGEQAFLVSVGAWTVACLTKPTVIPFAAVCVLWSCWKRRPSAWNVAEAALLALVLLVPQSVRSYAELGFIAPFGNPYLTKIQHRAGTKMLGVHFSSKYREQEMYWTSPTCYIRPLSPLSSWMIRRAHENTVFNIKVNAEHGARDWEAAYNSLNVGWTDWLEQWKENIVVFLFAPSWPESNSTQWDGRLESVSRWIWAPLVLLTVVCGLSDLARRRFELLPIGVTAFALFLLLQNVATAEGRYRKPLEPLLLMNAVWLVQRDAEHRRGRRGDSQERQAVGETYVSKLPA